MCNVGVMQVHDACHAKCCFKCVRTFDICLNTRIIIICTYNKFDDKKVTVFHDINLNSLELIKMHF